ncbi:MAG: metalloregulator ArsR/SmtB family transcription factor [Acidobacteriota bacterium]
MDGLSLIANSSKKPAIFDRLAALADPTRCRLLLVLEEQELTVSEICTVLQLPQSTVSRHLKTLSDDGWVSARRDGTSRRYASSRDARGDRSQRLWALLRDELVNESAAIQDRARLEEVVLERRARSQEFFSSTAGQWAQLREELFGSRFDLLALLALLDDAWVIGDFGCGTGQTAANLAPFVKQVIAVDDSQAMLKAARERLGKTPNVEIRQGRLETLPVDDRALDAAVLSLVLHHLPDPQKVLLEAGRTIRPGGKLLIVDMLPHAREDYRQQMGHVWLGFESEQLEGWLSAAGFDRVAIHPLPPQQEAKGPNIFAASAMRRTD